MKEADATAQTTLAILHLATREQSSHDVDVLTQLAQGIRRHSHRPPGAIAGAYSAYDAAGCDLIQ
jgi:hypothetical protein